MREQRKRRLVIEQYFDRSKGISLIFPIGIERCLPGGVMARTPRRSEIEPADQELADQGAINLAEKPKGRRALSRMRRELTEEELGNPAVQKLMMDDLDRLESEISELKRFREKYHEVDKKCDVMTEKLKPRIQADIFFCGFISVGSILVGLAPAVWDNLLAGIASAVLGLILVAGGIASKVVLK